VVNIQTGARTALSGLTRAVLLLVVVLGAARLTENIPLAVLAGIALKVGINILDWSFLKRAHKVSWQTTLIMYGVMLLTVFVDLIVAVGVGVFIANVLTIERLSELQAQNVKAISDADDDVPLTKEEKRLLDQTDGRVLLMYLSGPMIFGVSKAIAREHATIYRYESVVIDLSDVPLLDDTVSLAIENAVEDAVESKRQVFLASPSEQARQILERLGVFKLIPADHLTSDRTEALQRALALLPASQAPPAQIAGEQQAAG
jgi:SulP family sulfate permease